MSSKHISSSQDNHSKIKGFRQAGYEKMGKGRDALFELADAVIQMRSIQSFAELSCAPCFRRKWSSAYEAIQDGRIDREGWLEMYVKEIEEKGERVVLAGDHTAWEHLWGKTLAGRSYQHQPSAIPGRRPITIGHGYSTLAWVPEKEGSWALPVLHERIVDQKPIVAGAKQLERVCTQLGRRPITLWDSEYSRAEFIQATAAIPADKIIRMRTNLCLEKPPRLREGQKKLPKHGEPFKFRDPDTWGTPDETIVDNDAKFGKVIVRIWHGLRVTKAPDIPLIIAQIERVQQPGTRRKPRILWFAWIGQKPPEKWWNLYTRRYPVDHWYRFAKGRLHWRLPRFATPEQGERWSDLMPFITWELWLARPVVSDAHLPWQKPQTLLTPGRVCMGLQNLLPAIGTPTAVCKTRGIPKGWPKGKPRRPRQVFEIIRSAAWLKAQARKKPTSPPPLLLPT